MSEKTAKRARKPAKDAVRQSKARLATLDVRGGTPGAKPSPDQRSHPADASRLVEEFAKMHGITPHEAGQFLTQAKEHVGEFIKNGWDPLTTAHMLLMEMVMAAHHSQTTWDGLRVFVGEHAGPYYDLIGRFMDSKGETHEVRDATEGLVVPVQH